MRTFGIVALTVTAAACGIDPMPGTVCTSEARPSIAMIVVDSATGDGRAAGSSVVIVDGAYVDSTTRAVAAPLPSDSSYGLTNTMERPGTYTIRVRRAGYATWERQNVSVTGDICHVQTVVVRARLQAAP